MQKKRRLRNYLISPSQQLGFCIKISAISLLFSFIVLTAAIASLDQFMNGLSLMDTTEGALTSQVSSFWPYFIVFLIAAIFICSVIVCLSVIVESHKIMGAAYAIETHIKKILKSKDFSKPITLRKKDYLKNVAESLNQLLAEINQGNISPSENQKVPTPDSQFEKTS